MDKCIYIYFFTVIKLVTKYPILIKICTSKCPTLLHGATS